MSDLHKPLGTAEPKKPMGWQLPVLALALAGLSLLAYVFIDARPEDPTVIALGEEKTLSTTPDSNRQSANQGQIDGIDTPGSARPLSPLSPLEPLEPLTGQQNTAANRQVPAFKPQPVPKSRNNEWAQIPDLLEKSEFGPLPKISSGGMRPLDAYSKSSGTVGANRVAIIVGGLGLSQTGTQQAIRSLPNAVTLGFSPFGNSLSRWMQDAIKDGHEIVLQLPMEPLGYPAINPGPRTLVKSDAPGGNLGNLRWLLGRVTNYPLTMNYLGAGLSNDDDAMRPILRELKARGLAYLDDGSVQASIALEIAADIRLPHLKGDIVIDSRRNDTAIRANLGALEALARQKGFAVGTATAFPETINQISQWIEVAQKRGILIVPASNLVRDYR